MPLYVSAKYSYDCYFRAPKGSWPCRRSLRAAQLYRGARDDDSHHATYSPYQTYEALAKPAFSLAPTQAHIPTRAFWR